MTSRVDTARTIINDVKDLDWVVDGVSFMKASHCSLGTTTHGNRPFKADRFTNDQGKHTYVKFRWEGEDLLIDNTNVCHCGNQHTCPDHLHQVSSQDGMVT